MSLNAYTRLVETRIHNDPCDRLPGHLRAICKGESGHTAKARLRFLRRWVKKGRVPPEVLPEGDKVREQFYAEDQDDHPFPPNYRLRPCQHRGEEQRTLTCDTCSFKGQERTVYACTLLSVECFEGLGGFRAPAKITACRQCDKYAPLCVVCGQPATTFCSHGLANVVCGEPLCGTCQHPHVL